MYKICPTRGRMSCVQLFPKGPNGHFPSATNREYSLGGQMMEFTVILFSARLYLTGF